MPLTDRWSSSRYQMCIFRMKTNCIATNQIKHHYQVRHHNVVRIPRQPIQAIKDAQRFPIAPKKRATPRSPLGDSLRRLMTLRDAFKLSSGRPESKEAVTSQTELPDLPDPDPDPEIETRPTSNTLSVPALDLAVVSNPEDDEKYMVVDFNQEPLVSEAPQSCKTPQSVKTPTFCFNLSHIGRAHTVAHLDVHNNDDRGPFTCKSKMHDFQILLQKSKIKNRSKIFRFV